MMIKLLYFLMAFLSGTHCMQESNETEYQDDKFSSGVTSRDRLSVKHQIAYHFRRTVNEVTQELFLARQLDVEPLMLNLQILGSIAEKMQIYCKSNLEFSTDAFTQVNPVVVEELTYDPDNPTFVYVPEVGDTTSMEAEAKCGSYGMRLPEIYTRRERLSLMSFMIERGITHCHAGIRMDQVSGYMRFISTGLPIWKGDHYYVNHTRYLQQAVILDDVVDLMTAEFFYSANGDLQYLTMPSRPAAKNISTGSYYLKRRTDTSHLHREISELRTRVVCAPKYLGPKYDFLYRGKERDDNLQYLYVSSIRPGLHNDIKFTVQTESPFDALDRVRNNRTLIEPPTMRPEVRLETEPTADLVEWDRSIAESCNDVSQRLMGVYDDYYERIVDVLALTDITVKGETLDSKSVSKRSARQWVRALFRSGVRLIKDLMRMFRQVPKPSVTRKVSKATQDLNKLMEANQGKIRDDVSTVDLLISALKDHAVNLERMTICPDSLHGKLRALEKLVETISSSKPAQRVRVMNTIVRVNSMTDEIVQAMERGYTVFADIVHKSMAKATSPYTLSSDVLREVQGLPTMRRTKASFDQDFSLMQSCIVTDPADDHKLLIIINAAATAYENLELVEMMPIPYFIKDRAYYPKLESEFVVLNQPSMVYRSITPIEAEACMTGRCYISSMEKAVSSPSCGIAQYYDRYLEACDFESHVSNGMFVRAAPPDGVVYSFLNDYTGQLYCQNNVLIGDPLQMKGLGTMYIPSGCTLSISDRGHNLVKVRGPPTHHLLDGMADLTIAANSLFQVPIEVFQPRKPSNGSLEPFGKQLVETRVEVEFNRQEIISLEAHYWSGLCGLIFVIGLMLLCLQVLNQKNTKTSNELEAVVNRMVENDVLKAEFEQMKTSVKFMKETMMTEHLPPPPSRQGKFAGASFSLSRLKDKSSGRRPLPSLPSILGIGTEDNTPVMTPLGSLIDVRSNPFSPYSTERNSTAEMISYVEMHPVPTVRITRDAPSDLI